ncbi:hypothetical protein Thal_0470 [Thermocrinis albus DSM 14484]|uniref:Uncharacterized protein n=1 Tax=Thermocrinis albus (strain DSM 14484 / JCM 11386 / HI 11/12) TaxID=638303 RepID=D3SPL7_THEAH|nr:alpha/beta hydrolase [Thermocrinis albus]ADC89104.1 hypothetical protein Thal_0470 [Thermocrinis albus DSM 14484]
MFLLRKRETPSVLVHLHGFASDITSRKVKLLYQLSEERSFSFLAMDMEYHKTTTTQVLQFLHTVLLGLSVEFGEIILSGSSHGAYVVLNYLRFYPLPKVKKAFLFAPSYSTLALILRDAGYQKSERWLRGEEDLTLEDCHEGQSITINRNFAVDIMERGYEILVEDTVNFPQDPPAQLYITHGVYDDVVPVDHSRIFVKKVRVTQYKEVEDDHSLTKTFRETVEEWLP